MIKLLPIAVLAYAIYIASLSASAAQASRDAELAHAEQAAFRGTVGMYQIISQRGE